MKRQPLLDIVQFATSDRLAIVDGETAIGYRELIACMNVVRGALGRSGEAVQSGTIGLLVDRSLQSAVLLLSLLEYGAGLIPVDADADRAELERIGRTCGVRTWIAPDKTDTSAVPARCRRYSDLLEAGYDSAGDSAVADIPEAHVCLMTSGSTGRPKIACLSRDMIMREGCKYRQWFGYDGSDRVLSVVPLHHLYGLSGALLATILSGATLHIVRDAQPSAVAAAAARIAATVLVAVPYYYKLLSDNDRIQPDAFLSLRLPLSAGGKLDDSIEEAFRRRYRLHIRQVYGSTETGAVAATPADGAPGVGLSMAVLPGMKVGICGNGRITVSADQLYAGYLSDSGTLTDKPGGDTYVTPDIGTLDNGMLTIAGRLDRVLMIAGRKIGLEEIEQAMLSHPTVLSARAAEAADKPGWIEAAVALTPGHCLSSEQIRVYLSERLPLYKVPHIVRFMDYEAGAAGGWKQKLMKSEGG